MSSMVPPLQVKKVDPYVLHTTYVYGEQHGKRARLREAGLWLSDEPAYYDGPKYLSLDIELPPVRCGLFWMV